MTRYKLTLEYDGTGLAGWQRQKDQPSVQELLEKAIYDFSQETVETYAAGRTDAGVHARGQVIHFDLEKPFPLHNIQNGINFHLGDAAIVVINAEQVDDDFHARFSATKRSYLYRILNRPAPPALECNRVWHIVEALDINAMQNAAQHLIGKHDFTSFRATECQAKSPEKTLDKLEIEQKDEEIHFSLEAPSFLHHQVRNIVGTLRLVGNSKWTTDDVRTALETRDRTAAGPTSPACGLYLMRVAYQDRDGE